MSRRTADFRPGEILAALVGSGARFVLIGGLAADVHGVRWTTFDVDVLVAADDDNYIALVAALVALGAVFDTSHQPPIVPDLPRLRAATGPLLFRTREGRLDLLKDAGGETYQSVSVDALQGDVAGSSIKVASLAALARMKRAANRPKDRQVLPAIEAALAAASAGKKN